jgi:hypothetical protein
MDGFSDISPELNNIMNALKEMDAFKKKAKSPIVQKLLDQHVGQLMTMMNRVLFKIFSTYNHSNSK